MRMTIIPKDNAIVIDGLGLDVDCSSLDPRIHAIQWDGEAGVGSVEWINDPLFPDEWKSNDLFIDLAPYQSLIDAWEYRRDNPPPPPPPNPEYLRVMDAQIRLSALRDDPDRMELLQVLLSDDPIAIRQYVDFNITDIHSAKQFLAKLTLLVAGGIRR
jgi:hypothetical protein